MQPKDRQTQLDKVWVALRPLREQAKQRRHEIRFHEEVKALLTTTAQTCEGDEHIQEAVQHTAIRLAFGDAEAALEQLRNILIKAASCG